MKVIAIGSLVQTITPEQLQKIMPKEVPATLKHYLEGKIEQFWFREKAGPIFLMNVESLERANAELATLPLVAADLMTYELVPVTPLGPLGTIGLPIENRLAQNALRALSSKVKSLD